MTRTYTPSLLLTYGGEEDSEETERRTEERGNAQRKRPGEKCLLDGWILFSPS